MLVVVAAESHDHPSAAKALRRQGASKVTDSHRGGNRVLVYGGPFDDREALDVAAAVRAQGWPADMRPEAGGHLAAWQTHTRPVEVDHRLWVSFPWSEFDRDQVELVVEIDPGRAFGTGAHATTKLLLRELATRIKGGESVLDVGCGTGVLAITAARLGAAAVTALDTSPEAIAATTANASRNHLDEKVAARNEAVEHLSLQFDVVVANIHAGTLVELGPAIQHCLAPNGWVGLSGLSPAQTSVVEASYNEMTVTARPQDEDWCAVVAIRK